jgi:hypothetical protein
MSPPLVTPLKQNSLFFLYFTWTFSQKKISHHLYRINFFHMTPPLKKDGLLYLYYVCIYVCVGLKDWPLIYNIDMNTSLLTPPHL